MASVSIDKRCSVPACGKTCAEAILHCFPNPETDPDRFRTWVYAVGGDILATDNYVIHKYRRVCHIHFEKQYHTRSKRLACNAVPTLHLPGFSMRREPLRPAGPALQPVPEINPQVPQVNLEVPKVIASTSKGLSMRREPLRDVTNRNRPTGPALQPVPEINPQVPEVIASTTKEKNKSKKNTIENEHSILARKIKSLQRAKDRYQTRLKKALRLSENPTFLKSLRNFTTMAFMFTMMQFREFPKQKMGHRFTKKEKVMALSLYKQGPKAYRWLRMFFVLPSPVTLSRMISLASLKPGINENLFKQLHERVKKMNNDEKVCILLFDEMALAAHLDYSSKFDFVKGFVNNGKSINKQFADHALVFMIRGVFKNYKLPVSYSFCKSSTKKDELSVMIKEIIRKLKSVGLNVIATICDQGTNNVSAIKELIAQTKAEYMRKNEQHRHQTFEIDGDEIMPLFDTPHLIKGLRNNLLKKPLQCVIEGKRKVARWSHIQLLHEENPAYQGIRLMPKLTANHVDPKKINKMKVKYATQVFSQSVAANMGYLADKKILPEECKDTADIIIFLDKLFDSFNGSYDNSKKRPGKDLLGPVTPKSEHWRVWSSAKVVLSSMGFVAEGKVADVPSIRNWLHNINIIERLVIKLFEEYNFKSIWLRHFNQDPLENFFGSIRSHGIRNTNPTCAAFETAFASLLINNFGSYHSAGSNCEKDSCHSFTSLNKLFFNKDPVESSCAPVEIDVNDIFNEDIIIGLERKRMDAKIIAQLQYVTGYVLKKTKDNVFRNCKNCKECLYSKEENSYIKLREHAPHNRKSLTYPADDLVNCFSDIQDVVTRIIRVDSSKPNIKMYLKTVLSVVMDYTFIKCDRHKKKITAYIEDLSCKFFLYNWCKDINKILNGSRVDFDKNDIVQKMASEYYNTRRKDTHNKNRKVS